MFWSSLKYISENRPRLVLYENVANLYLKFYAVYESIVKIMEKMQYIVLNKENPLFNTIDHGIPHNRERMLLFFVREDSFVRPFVAPEALDHAIKLQALLSVHCVVCFKAWAARKGP